jgi:hypothetical protein
LETGHALVSVINATQIATATIEPIMPSAPQDATIFLLAAIIVAVLVHAITLKLKGDPRLLILLGCGATGTLLEGFACHLINCYHSPVGMYEIYKAFGIHVPLWMAELYVLFFGALPYYFFERLRKVPTSRYYWWFFFIVAASEGMGEMLDIHLGMFTYRGTQPLPILGFPIYLGFINATQTIVFAWIAVLWFENVRGPLSYLLILLAPALLTATFSGLTFPTVGFIYGGHLETMVIGSIGSIILSLSLAALSYRGLRSYIQQRSQTRSL